VFQPLADGKPSGKFVVFADGSQGPSRSPPSRAPADRFSGRAGWRALYSDDAHGRIWRVTFSGGAAVTGIEAAPAPSAGSAAAGNVEPPEGIHPDAGAPAAVASLPVPPGATAAQVARGERVYHGQGGGTCEGCHGSNAKGTRSHLTSRAAMGVGDGSLAAITRTIAAACRTQGIQERNASHGRRPALSFRSRSCSRLCMGAGHQNVH